MISCFTQAAVFYDDSWEMDSDRPTAEVVRCEHSKGGATQTVMSPQNISVTPHVSYSFCCCCEKIPQPNKTKAIMTKRDLRFQRCILASVSRCEGESRMVRKTWQSEEAAGSHFPTT